MEAAGEPPPIFSVEVFTHLDGFSINPEAYIFLFSFLHILLFHGVLNIMAKSVVLVRPNAG